MIEAILFGLLQILAISIVPVIASILVIFNIKTYKKRKFYQS